MSWLVCIHYKTYRRGTSSRCNLLHPLTRDDMVDLALDAIEPFRGLAIFATEISSSFYLLTQISRN